MGLSTKLLRRLHSRPLASVLSSSSRNSPLLFSNRNSAPIFSTPTLLIPFRSFSWFSSKPPSDDGHVGGGGPGEMDGEFLIRNSSSLSDFKLASGAGGIAADVSVASSGSEFNVAGNFQSGAEPSSLALDGSGILEEVSGNESVWYYPVLAVISALDGYHEFSGLPWWAIISTSTLALRLSLFPVLICQLRKAEVISSFMPKLPPPFPPPLSGRGFGEQYLLFQKKRKELGCPSYLWNFLFLTVQVPCFLLWMTSIRRMCLDGHPGFDTGGALWFLNLTDIPSGILGSVFPILISGLHYVNVQISFQNINAANLKGILGFLTKYYKLYLNILAAPLLLIAFHVPQGSLVYWATNSSLTLLQQLSLRNPYIRKKFGLQDIRRPVKKHISSENVLPDENIHLEIQVPMDSLPPQKLLDLALEEMASGHNDKAISMLETAIEKDPELVRALIAMGQILCSQSSFLAAAKHFEDAIRKIDKQEDSLLVLAIFGAGVSHLWQGNKSVGIKYLRKIAELKEPEDPMDKACYHKGLVILGSTLMGEGEKSEAVKYLRIAATYDPAVSAYIKECEEG
ncbi:ALBINO3-like protein 2, chloroplastic [Zingiber officinale]|uniref:ALBINO3-like protein 2, chloroplastic n=1 Tax=Zingiber officinale TaxID=94328 RepID=UPI001C4D7FE2|nr:ALBINO3-like protein 2, chloroplastic [Zingiber officinale]